MKLIVAVVAVFSAFAAAAAAADAPRREGARTDGKLGEETMPTSSPDGRTIVFVSNRDGNFELYAIDRTGGNERRITTARRSDETNPRFGRDAKRLPYVHEGRVATVRLDGTGVRELGRGDAADWR
jgi:Tol biopolymer transport system component